LTVPLRELDPRRPVTLPPDAKVAEAVALMNEEGIGAVCITESERIVGIFTERDVLTKVAGRQLDFDSIPVGDYMTRDPEVLKLDARAAYAVNMMVVGGFRHVPIVDEEDKLVGVISVRDIVEFLADLYPDLITGER
jgi:CBS domain-containing protein